MLASQNWLFFSPGDLQVTLGCFTFWHDSTESILSNMNLSTRVLLSYLATLIIQRMRDGQVLMSQTETIHWQILVWLNLTSNDFSLSVPVAQLLVKAWLPKTSSMTLNYFFLQMCFPFSTEGLTFHDTQIFLAATVCENCFTSSIDETTTENTNPQIWRLASVETPGDPHRDGSYFLFASSEFTTNSGMFYIDTYASLFCGTACHMRNGADNLLAVCFKPIGNSFTRSGSKRQLHVVGIISVRSVWQISQLLFSLNGFAFYLESFVL